MQNPSIIEFEHFITAVDYVLEALETQCSEQAERGSPHQCVVKGSRVATSKCLGNVESKKLFNSLVVIILGIPQH
jgi:hypothetical protein